MFDGNSDSEDSVKGANDGFKINEAFAKKYDYNAKRDEKDRL